MVKTFTPALDFIAEQNEKEAKDTSFGLSEPSQNVIQTILNYSRNLEVKQSKLLRNLELLKS
jgi:hypothetical protein